MLHSLCKLRRLDSVFKLLVIERQRVLADAEALKELSALRTFPESHRWQLNGLDRTMIKSDDPFIANDAVWRLGLTYHRLREATLKVNLSLVTNPFAGKKAKIYYKRNEFFRPPDLK